MDPIYIEKKYHLLMDDYQKTAEGVTATRCFSPFFIFSRKTQKHNFWQFSKYVDYSCKNEQDIVQNSEFRRFCNEFTA